jgi:hypothetical protein
MNRRLDDAGGAKFLQKNSRCAMEVFAGGSDEGGRWTVDGGWWVGGKEEPVRMAGAQAQGGW